jgi:hypothetical protein
MIWINYIVVKFLCITVSDWAQPFLDLSINFLVIGEQFVDIKSGLPLQPFLCILKNLAPHGLERFHLHGAM